MRDNETFYDGALSPEPLCVEIKGAPVSGRELTIRKYVFAGNGQPGVILTGDRGKEMSLSDYIKYREGRQAPIFNWRQKIRTGVQKTLDGRYDFPIVPSADTQYEKDKAFTDCLLNVTFFLCDNAQPDSERSNYEKIDLDNLLKPVLDALYSKEDGVFIVVTDDSYFAFIQTKKEPVETPAEEGIAIRADAAKTFTIESVEEVDGKDLMPNYWRQNVQRIEAVDSKNNRGVFFDNMPGTALKTKKDNWNAIPGYEWQAGKKERGCLAIKRAHIYEDLHREFHWLKKWG